MAYDNTDRGVLFDNDRKEKDSHPDMTGSINVDGVEYFLDAWKKESKGGKHFLSVSVKRKNNQQPREGQEPAQQRPQRTAPTARPARAPAPTARPAPVQYNDPDLDAASEDDLPF